MSGVEFSPVFCLDAELILRWLEGVPGSPGKSHNEGQADFPAAPWNSFMRSTFKKMRNQPVLHGRMSWVMLQIP